MVGNGHAYCITGWSYNINLGLDKDCINSKQLINHGPMVADSGRDLVLGSVCMRHLWDSFVLVGERTCTGLSGFTPALSGHSVTMQDWPNLGKPEAVKSDKPHPGVFLPEVLQTCVCYYSRSTTISSMHDSYTEYTSPSCMVSFLQSPGNTPIHCRINEFQTTRNPPTSVRTRTRQFDLFRSLGHDICMVLFTSSF